MRRALRKARFVSDVYTHGHHDSVLRGHRWRTAANSAGYLLDRLRPGLDLLDLGCGPGSITSDLAALVAPGRALGIDRSERVLGEARQKSATAGRDNAEFTVGDVYDLADVATASFDIVHAHQVLQHLTDPVAALCEAKRVLRPGGLLAVRDADYAAFCWAPSDPRLDRWLQLYHEVTLRNGAQADAGRWLPTWVSAAGFGQSRVTSSTWTFSDPADRAWWGGQWAERTRSSDFANQALAYGLATESDLADISAAFLTWADETTGVFVTVHVEVLATAL